MGDREAMSPACRPRSAWSRFLMSAGEYLGLVDEHTWVERGDEEIARAFHEAYERLAPMFGYATRVETRVPWADVPAANRELMVAVVFDLRRRHVIDAGDIRTTCICRDLYEAAR
ncbi:MAG: hypothetical protein JO222_03970 [Frankiales bacterium]|nr:hypothetical protein [Frankiales bacterium]